MLQNNKMRMALIKDYLDKMGADRRFEVVNKENDEATIYLYDTIGEDFYGGVSALKFCQELDALKGVKTLHLRINSPGGDVDEARAIQTGLNQYPGQIVAHIDGQAASAATYIMLAADEIEMSEGARVMIHNAWGFVMGNKNDMRKCADSLDNIDAAIANDYVQRTGQTLAQVQYWMNEGTEFMASDALKFGFVDRIYKPEAPKKETQNKIDNNDERIYAERELELIELSI